MEKDILTIEAARELIKEELGSTIMENLDSAIIFQYINDLEKEVASKKEALTYIDRLINKMQNEGADFDPLALLCTLKAVLEREI